MVDLRYATARLSGAVQLLPYPVRARDRTHARNQPEHYVCKHRRGADVASPEFGGEKKTDTKNGTEFRSRISLSD